ncbi:MAG: ankyrin repeat protein [Lysobacterales bacterium]|jgi:ankyrin repeat protein
MNLKNILLPLLISLLSIASSDANTPARSIYNIVRSGNMDAVKIFLKQHNDQAVLNNGLGAAIIGRQYAILDYLVEQGADVNYLNNNTPILIQAIMSNRIESAKKLIAYGADVTARGYTRQEQGMNIRWDWSVLMCATRNGDLTLIKEVLKNGANITDTGWSLNDKEIENSADIAAYSGHLHVLKFLLKTKALTLNNNTIFKTVRGGHIETVKYLLKDLKDINRQGPFRGRSLLIEAAWWGYPKMVQLLIDEGADVNAMDAYGYTAVSEATDKDFSNQDTQYQVVQTLIDNGADLNIKSHTGIYPLDRALKYGNENITMLLIENSAERTLFDN